jgi:hypothetical protein
MLLQARTTSVTEMEAASEVPSVSIGEVRRIGPVAKQGTSIKNDSLFPSSSLLRIDRRLSPLSKRPTPCYGIMVPL